MCLDESVESYSGRETQAASRLSFAPGESTRHVLIIQSIQEHQHALCIFSFHRRRHENGNE